MYEKIAEEIRRISDKYGIIYALLFGSSIDGYMLRSSDIDIAVMLKGDPKNFGENLRISVKISSILGRSLGREVDIIILNTAPLGLKYEIYTTGKILFCSDRERFIDDLVKTIGMYQDFRIFISPLYRKLVEKYEGKYD
ncbi:MAG: hypothetical protein DRJ34_03765 [Thermoprotei archaeon]|nr:MAG: hypothetical protein DRJ34_03765 [Thermoprotei archaeon]